MVSLNNLKIFCDGGARGNPGPGAFGFVVKDEGNRVIVKENGFLGKTTNNVAEYQAVIHALSWLKCNPLSIIHYPLSIIFYLDSQLVVNQLKGIYKVKKPHLQALIIKAKDLESQLKAEVFYQLIPRSKNFEADSLVNQELDRYK